MSGGTSGHFSSKGEEKRKGDLKKVHGAGSVVGKDAQQVALVEVGPIYILISFVLLEKPFVLV